MFGKFVVLFVCFGTGSCYVAQAKMDLKILLPQMSESQRLVKGQGLGRITAPVLAFLADPPESAGVVQKTTPQ